MLTPTTGAGKLALRAGAPIVPSATADASPAVPAAGRLTPDPAVDSPGTVAINRSGKADVSWLQNGDPSETGTLRELRSGARRCPNPIAPTAALDFPRQGLNAPGTAGGLRVLP